MRFWRRRGPFSLAELAELAGAGLARRADADRRISDIASLARAGPGEIAFLDNTRYRSAFAQTRAEACLVDEKHAGDGREGLALLISAEPAAAFARIAGAFYPEAQRPQGVWEEDRKLSAAAHIHPSSRLEEGVVVEPGAIIGPRAEIGADTIIAALAVVGADVKIGRSGYIGPHASIVHCLLGDGVFIHAGARIGQDGFGYAAATGGITKIPQVGRVIIQNHVEIGANAAIDRGSNQDTIIGEGSRIDNLVQIAHNVRIGRNCLIAAQVGIAGSSVIDDGASMGGQVGIAGHLSIGAGAQIAAQSGVSRNIPPGAVYGGYLARPIREWHEQEATIRRIWKKRTHRAAAP